MQKNASCISEKNIKIQLEICLWKSALFIIQCLFCYRKAALEAALRKKIECEKKALSVVEQLLEEDITEEFLLNCVGVASFYIVLYLGVVPFF